MARPLLRTIYKSELKGFPLDDIDIPFVLAQRHRLAGVETNQNASVESAGASAALQNIALRDSWVDNDVDLISGMPFAIVDEIADASPAAEDGLQLGDQIVKFVMRQGALFNLSVSPRTWQGRGLLGCHFRIM
ncbi:hypothetical protein F3Y22_tig00001825pilonHSYRG00150 [Hibiscus syriacus]|uniref:Uncharacterized protein n=1 Tax=Hibiscus syriacus TaxID=106335 RepID=A0A6A3CZB5_HIBSY|nr:hypothetical protein F3Y22_tig00001825pilonHSYRG00150 [Hibiscus syriacus]